MRDAPRTGTHSRQHARAADVRRRIHRQRENKPMPVAALPPYPKSLTTASWDKAKGLIARISKVKTDVTEELQAAERAFKAAPFGELNVSPLVLNKSLDLKGLKQVQDDYLRKYQPRFRALELVFYDLSQTFKKKAAEFEADPKLKQLAPALKTMSADANKFTYAVAWGTVSSPNQKYLQDMITSQEKSPAAQFRQGGRATLRAMHCPPDLTQRSAAARPVLVQVALKQKKQQLV
jgi:hypothetical protein